MTSHEPRPLAEPVNRADADSAPAEPPAAETNGRLDPDLQELRAKFGEKVDNFSRQITGRANQQIELIRIRRDEVSQLEAEVDRSAQELAGKEAEFERLGGSGRLTPEACDRTEIAYHSYLTEHRREQIMAAKRIPPGPKGPDPVSYADFLRYGVLRLDTPQINGQDQTEPVNKLFQPLRLSYPSHLKDPEAAKWDGFSPVRETLIPSSTNLEFLELKQSQDTTGSALLLNQMTEHRLAGSGRENFGFGAYYPGRLDQNDPAVKGMLDAAVEHLVFRRDCQAKSRRLKANIPKAFEEIEELGRQLVVT